MPADALPAGPRGGVRPRDWNLLTAGGRRGQVAAGVALLIGALVFLPVRTAGRRRRSEALPYAAASVALELGYLACLATAYQRGPLSVVYPVARGTAPVLVLIGSALFLAIDADGAQVAGVLLGAPPACCSCAAASERTAADVGLALVTALLHRRLHGARRQARATGEADRLAVPEHGRWPGGV